MKSTFFVDCLDASWQGLNPPTEKGVKHGAEKSLKTKNVWKGATLREVYGPHLNKAQKTGRKTNLNVKKREYLEGVTPRAVYGPHSNKSASHT